MTVFKTYDGEVIDDIDHSHVVQDTRGDRYSYSVSTTELINKTSIKLNYYTSILPYNVTDETLGSRTIYVINTTEASEINGNIVLTIDLANQLTSDSTYLLLLEPVENNNTKTNIINMEFGISKPYNYYNGLYIPEPIRRTVSGFDTNNQYMYKITPKETLKSLLLQLYTTTKINSSSKTLLKISIRKLESTMEDNVAISTKDEAGFMSVEDKYKINRILEISNYIESKLQTALFYRIEKPIKLVKGSEFSTIINSVSRTATSIVFTKDAIPEDKLDDAKLISDSVGMAYAYLDGTTIYVAPREANSTIYANEDCSSMFSGVKAKTVTFDNFDTSNTTTMSRMFTGFTGSSLDLTSFNMSKVSDISWMFTFTSLTSLDLTGWNTSNVTTMSYTFNNNWYLLTIKGLEALNTSKVTDMSKCFSGVNIITSLDLTGWDTSNVTNMNAMFNACKKVVTIKGLEDLNTSKVTDMGNMFELCGLLNGSMTIMNSNTSKYSSMFSYACTDTGSGFTLNYKSGCQTVAQKMVDTATSSKVKLGTQV